LSLSILRHNRITWVAAIVAIFCLDQCCQPAAAKRTHTSKATAKSQPEKADNFPLTNLKLATKPVSRWAYGYLPLNSEEISNDPTGYLKELEENMSHHDAGKGIKAEDDKRFAETIQFFIQQLLAENRKADAIKLEHRLARIEAKHPEFYPATTSAAPLTPPNTRK
jgi:hypothetical protein